MKNHRFTPFGANSTAIDSRISATQAPPRSWGRSPLMLASLASAAALAAGLSTAASAAGTPAENRSATAQPAADQAKSGMKAYRGLRASEVIGMSVRNPQGNNIGQISDMIVNLNTGEVQYAVLTFDPGILQGEKLYSVPTTELRMAPDRNDIVYNMSREKLERASVDRADWDRLSRDQGFFTNLDRLWGVKPATPVASAYRVSALIDKDVKSRSGEDIGEIEELVIDMANQRVHYAVMQFDPGWTTTGQNYAFPLRSFNLAANRSDLVLDIDKSLLRSMKSFADDRYERLNDAVWVADIDRYLITVRPLTSAGTNNVGSNAGNTNAANSSTGNTNAANSSTGNTSAADTSAGSTSADSMGDARSNTSAARGIGDSNALADRTQDNNATYAARAPRSDRN